MDVLDHRADLTAAIGALYISLAISLAIENH